MFFVATNGYAQIGHPSILYKTEYIPPRVVETDNQALNPPGIYFSTEFHIKTMTK